MIPIDSKLINTLVPVARNNERGRKHHNFHKSYQEPVQRLLNAIEPGSYIRPHRHSDPDKTEIFMILEGRFLVILFNESGKVSDHIILDRNTGIHGVEISPGEYHTIAALETGSVAYEIKNGPFNAETDKKFAPWAPEEGTAEGYQYLQALIRKLPDK